MHSDTTSAPLVAVFGPTASGKSSLALDLAEKFDGEIINCDSMQVYRGFDIGTAKVPASEQRSIPHHLIDICEPSEIFSAGDYARQARKVLADISERGRLPIIAGGTGFYLRALFHGLFAGPPRDPDLRKRLEGRSRRRPDSLHRLLRRFDPAAAERIHPNDQPKLVRALEVCILTRTRMSELFATGRHSLSGYRCLQLMLDPPRSEVYDRINQRTAEMFQRGLVDEVKNLLRAGVDRNAQPMRAVGYREAIAVADGVLTLDDAIHKTRQATRNYAKRQWTWFRKQPGTIMLQGFGDQPAIVEHAIELVREFLINTKR